LARRLNDYGAAWSPQDDRIDKAVSGRCCPSADVYHGPRASTKGRVEARSHIDKNDRLDLAKTDRNTVTSRRKTHSAQQRNKRLNDVYCTKSVLTDYEDCTQIQQTEKHPQATKSAETPLDNEGSFREGRESLLRAAFLSILVFARSSLPFGHAEGLRPGIANFAFAVLSPGRRVASSPYREEEYDRLGRRP